MAVENIANRNSNNYNLIRLILALIVAFGHGALIFKLPIYFDLFKIPSVGLFFFISGIFVSQSLLKSRSIKSFLFKRIARIYPAAWFVILFSIVVLGFLTTTCSSSYFFSSGETWRYILENAILFKMEFFHSCIFIGSPLSNQVNASLWSLQYEVVAYVTLLIIGIIGLTKKPKWLLTGVIIIVLLGTWLQLGLTSWSMGNVYFVGLVMATFFLLGVFAFYSKKVIELKPLLVLCCILGLVILYFIPVFSFLMIPSYCYLTLFIGSKMKPLKWSWIKRNDISYGVYLLHFPLFQFFRSLELDVGYGFTLGLMTTILIAIFSWKIIEQPSMRWVRIKS